MTPRILYSKSRLFLNGRFRLSHHTQYHGRRHLPSQKILDRRYGEDLLVLDVRVKRSRRRAGNAKTGVVVVMREGRGGAGSGGAAR